MQLQDMGATIIPLYQINPVKPPIEDTLKEDKPPNKGHTIRRFHCTSAPSHNPIL